MASGGLYSENMGLCLCIPTKIERALLSDHCSPSKPPRLDCSNIVFYFNVCVDFDWACLFQEGAGKLKILSQWPKDVKNEAKNKSCISVATLALKA